ncbi:glycosyltransferase [Pseudanabaena sp. FACHB-1998]|uniref:glycosyltransferase n=1 Tax=Pseudanabaena sp. FACHB-1998 TaxID=2692858 RepID=UPI0032203080
MRLLQQPNAGVASARNLGIQSAQGEFIALIDSDDLWYPDALEKLVAQFQRSLPAVGVIYAWSVDIDEYDRPIEGFHAATIKGNVYRTLICHNFLGNASATLIRKACLDHVGGYDTQLKAQKAQGCEDWDLYLRLAEHYEFEVVTEFLIGYRKVASSMSRDFRQMARSQQLMLQSIQKNHPELSSYLYRLSRSSFYLYLAQQCDAYGDARETLDWLRQAVKADPISSLGRLGLYILLIKNLAKLGGKSWRLFRLWTLFKPPRLPINELSVNESLYPTTYPLSLPIHPLKIWLKVMVGALLHHSLSRI